MINGHLHYLNINKNNNNDNHNSNNNNERAFMLTPQGPAVQMKSFYIHMLLCVDPSSDKLILHYILFSVNPHIIKIDIFLCVCAYLEPLNLGFS